MNLFCYRICSAKVHKCINTPYTRGQRTDEVISSGESVARRILYFRTALQGITVYIVALVIESKRASLSSSSEPRYLRGKDCDTWKARDIPRLRRWEPGQDRRMADPWHRSFIVEARESRPRGPIAQQRATTEERKPDDFRRDFFATIFSHATVHLIPLPPSR